METLPPHRAERRALCDLLLAVGPDAPTLCDGWVTRDLAAHLYVREHRPVAAAGIVLPGPFAPVLARAMDDARSRPYPELVEAVRTGPPALLRPVDHLVNTLELFVHHEDVRRGGGSTAPRPDSEIAEVESELWRALGRMGRLLGRSLGPVGLVLERPDGARLTIHRARQGMVTMSGRPGELALFCTGRQAAAHVELTGPDEAVAAVRAASFGL